MTHIPLATAFAELCAAKLTTIDRYEYFRSKLPFKIGSVQLEVEKIGLSCLCWGSTYKKSQTI